MYQDNSIKMHFYKINIIDYLVSIIRDYIIYSILLCVYYYY